MNKKALSIIAIVVLGIVFFFFMRCRAFSYSLWIGLGTGIIVMLSLLTRTGWKHTGTAIKDKREIIGALKMAIIAIWGFILYLNLEHGHKNFAWSFSIVLAWITFSRMSLSSLPGFKTKAWYNKKLW